MSNIINENRLIQELPQKSMLDITDRVLIEDEDGTKTADMYALKRAIIGTTFFQTIQDLKEAEVSEGDICVTLGYRTPGDGGGATYIIINDPVAREDNAFIHYLDKSDILKISMVVEYGVSPESCGAYGDGSRDDSDAINAIISKGYKLSCNINKTYMIEYPIKLKSNIHLDFNSSLIIPRYCNAFEMTIDSDNNTGNIENYTLEDITIKNFILDMIDGTGGIISNYVLNHISISNFKIFNNKNYGIRITSGKNITIEDFNIIGLETSQFNIGISFDAQKEAGFEYPICDCIIDNGTIRECYPGIMGSNNKDSIISINNVKYSSDISTDSTSMRYSHNIPKCPIIPTDMTDYNGFEEKYITNTKSDDYQLYITTFYKHNTNDSNIRIKHVVWLWSKLSLNGTIGRLEIKILNHPTVKTYNKDNIVINTTSNIAYDTANKVVLYNQDTYSLSKTTLSEIIDVSLITAFGNDKSVDIESGMSIINIMSNGISSNDIPQSALFKTSVNVRNNISINNCNVLAQVCVFSLYSANINIENLKSDCWAILDIRNDDSMAILNGYIANYRSGGILVSHMYSDIYNNASIITDSNGSTKEYGNYSGTMYDQTRNMLRRTFDIVTDNNCYLENIFNMDLNYTGASNIIINNIVGGMDNQIISISAPEDKTVTINHMMNSGNIHLIAPLSNTEPSAANSYILKYGSIIYLRKVKTQWYQIQ